MLQHLNLKRILQGLSIMLICTSSVSSYLSQQYTNKDAINSLYFKDSYTNIINDLRDHWQSPITYLKKRGYLPEIKNEPNMNFVKLTEDANDNKDLSNLKDDNFQQELKKRQSSAVTNQMDDKKPLTNSIGLENDQGNPTKVDASENYQGNLGNTVDTLSPTNSLAVDPAAHQPANNRIAGNVQENTPKMVNKPPSVINSLAVEKVLENLGKTDDKQIKDLSLGKGDDPGFFTNMKNKFMGLFSKSELDAPIKIKHTKLLKELEKDIQKELNKGTLTKTYAQKAVQTMVSNEYNYLENDLQNNYDNSVNKDDDKMAFGPN